ncbi:MAG: glutamate formimidoyltransferase [Planctomycetales bacterium]|nr:glutamate formimidoyltransferase [bacterium]UNM10040.1 MAG: glutamate formimidoyltransferase [Planctomycetales bacterium]
MKIVECVPNISNGRDPHVYNTVAQEAAAVDGVTLLDVDPGHDTNRTVITFAGEPEAVLEAAFRVVRKAAQLIDMSRQHGEHPRHGATDVCPFVPVQGVEMAECVELAKRLGERVGSELGIPVWLYEHAARKPEWRNLANVRHGEYEALKGKLGTEEWRPDYGPNEFSDSVARTGVVTVGARNFLVAYNINFNTKALYNVNLIAWTIREKGRQARDEHGKFVKDADGNDVYAPGLYKGLKAMGWYIDEYQCAQITMNVTDLNASPLHVVFDKVDELAREYGLRVTGSELVGLIPLSALTDAGRHFLRKQKKVCTGVSERELVRVAIQTLGLTELGEFDPQKRIVEYAIDDSVRPLAKMSVTDFVEELASVSPAPGGGSVAALAGALAAGLAAMVPNLTVGKPGYAPVKKDMNRIATRAQQLKDEYLRAIDDDTAAFNILMDTFGMPKNTDEEQKARSAAIKQATVGVTEVPLATLKRCVETLELCREVAEKGNQNALSDAGTGAAMALACAEGAYYNVLINTNSMPKKSEYRAKVREEADAAMAQSRQIAGVVREQMEKGLG